MNNVYSSIGFLLINTAFQAKQKLSTLLQQKGIDATVDQYAVISALMDEDGISQKELCEKSCKNDSNLTRILSVMENREYILRKKGKDGRSRNVYLTEKGRNLYNIISPYAISYEKELFKNFSPNEINMLKNLLNNIRNEL